MSSQNADFKSIMHSGEYIYADGHVVRNDPRYVRKVSDREHGNCLLLTDWANSHVDACCLRFVRNQPVALSFLFTGLRQRKARRGAAFFIVPMLLCLALFALITSRFEFFSLPQVESPEALLEYIKNNPDSMRKFLSCFVLLLFLAFVFYFPFTFVWSFVYDKTKQPFGKSLLEGLKFFAARPVHFFAFEFCAHFKLFFLIAVFDVLRVCIYKKNSAEAMLYSFGSLTSFASFALTFYTAASVILSIQFYYEQFNNEDSNKAS